MCPRNPGRERKAANARAEKISDAQRIAVKIAKLPGLLRPAK
jgi:hypothetical protein